VVLNLFGLVGTIPKFGLSAGILYFGPHFVNFSLPEKLMTFFLAQSPLFHRVDEAKLPFSLSKKLITLFLLIRPFPFHRVAEAEPPFSLSEKLMTFLLLLICPFFTKLLRLSHFFCT
jgi:hypothetical protein